MKKIFIFLIMSLISLNAFAAAFYTGNDIKSKLNSSLVNDNIFALGYVAAISDSLNRNKVNGFPACLPDYVELGQIKDVVKIFFDKHPEIMHFAASGLVATALAEAFPCSPKNAR